MYNVVLYKTYYMHMYNIITIILTSVCVYTSIPHLRLVRLQLSVNVIMEGNLLSIGYYESQMQPLNMPTCCD